MRTWKGKRTSVGERTTKEKCEPKPKLSLPDKFFMVLVRLRLGRVVEDLADCFYVSPSTVSRTFTTWINLMYFKFQELPMWMSRRKVDKHMPPSFPQWYPTTRVIIDTTEFFIEKPSSLARQSASWSSYKNHNTFNPFTATGRIYTSPKRPSRWPRTYIYVPPQFRFYAFVKARPPAWLLLHVSEMSSSSVR